MFTVARLFSWHYMLVNTVGSLLMGHREWWSTGRCFRPCVAPHQTCLSFNVTSAINTHLFVFLSALRYLESTHIGTLAYTHGGAHNTCTFSLHRPFILQERSHTLATSIYAQTVPRYWSLPSSGVPRG